MTKCFLRWFISSLFLGSQLTMVIFVPRAAKANEFNVHPDKTALSNSLNQKKFETPPAVNPTAARSLVNSLGTASDTMVLWAQEQFKNQHCQKPKGRPRPSREIQTCSPEDALFVSGEDIAHNIDKNYFDWAARQYHHSVQCRLKHYRCFDANQTKASGASQALREGLQSIINLQVQRLRVMQGLPLPPEMEAEFQSYWTQWNRTASDPDKNNLVQKSAALCAESKRRMGNNGMLTSFEDCKANVAPRLWFLLAQINFQWATFPTEIASILENVDLFQLLNSAPPKSCAGLDTPEIREALAEKKSFLQDEDLKLTSSCSARKDGKGCFYQPAPPMKSALWTWIKPSLISDDEDIRWWYCENELKYGTERIHLEKSALNLSLAISIGSLLVPPARALLTAPLTPALRLQFAGGATAQLAQKKIPGLAQVTKTTKTVASQFKNLSMLAGWGTTTVDLATSCFPSLKNKVPRPQLGMEPIPSENCTCQDLAPDLRQNAPTASCLTKVTGQVLDKVATLKQIKIVNDAVAAESPNGLNPRFDQRLDELLFPFTDQGHLLSKEALPQLEAWGKVCNLDR